MNYYEEEWWYFYFVILFLISLTFCLTVWESSITFSTTCYYQYFNYNNFSLQEFFLVFLKYRIILLQEAMKHSG